MTKLFLWWYKYFVESKHHQNETHFINPRFFLITNCIITKGSSASTINTIMLGSSQYLFCFVFSESNLLRSQICSIPSTLKWRKVITRVLGIMLSNSHNGKKSSNPPATGRAKLYDVLDNDQYRHVMMMTLLITTLIISIIMMVITVISLAAFRIGYFLILS